LTTVLRLCKCVSCHIRSKYSKLFPRFCEISLYDVWDLLKPTFLVFPAHNNDNNNARLFVLATIKLGLTRWSQTARTLPSILAEEYEINATDAAKI